MRRHSWNRMRKFRQFNQIILVLLKCGHGGTMIWCPFFLVIGNCGTEGRIHGYYSGAGKSDEGI